MSERYINFFLMMVEGLYLQIKFYFVFSIYFVKLSDKCNFLTSLLVKLVCMR